MSKGNLNRDYLEECFEYNGDTGQLIWKERPAYHFKNSGRERYWNRRYASCVAGSVQRTKRGHEYIGVKVNGEFHKAHRLIWIMSFGNSPVGVIDHIDGNALNNKINNLRDVSHSINSRNTKVSARNETGIIGVYWLKSKRRWQSKITDVNGKRKALGLTDDFFEACCRRKSAELSMNYHKNHGRAE